MRIAVLILAQTRTCLADKHADDFVLLNEDPTKLQFFLDRLNDSVRMFGIRFAPPKCKMLLWGLGGSKPRETTGCVQS